MNAAQRLFLEQGVGSTTIEQIAAGAKVAKGTFYLQFSSKEELLAALGERFAQGHLKGIESALADTPEGDWSGRLAAWADACVNGYLDAIRLHDVAFYGTRPATREGLVDNIVIDHLAELLKAGVGAGAWSVDDVRFTAVFLFGGLHAVVDDAYAKERRPNRRRLLQRARRLCLGAVGLAAG